MRAALFAAAMIGALVVTAAMMASGPVQVRAAQTNIDVGDFYFCDQSFQGGICEKTINAGDTVVWSASSGTHNVTECDASYATCPTTGGFVSSALSQGQQFQRTFSSAGTFYYECTFHPQAMKGRVVVQAQATSTPSPTPSPTTAQTTAPTTAASATPTRTPAAVPATGGSAGGGDGAAAGLAVLAGGLAALTGGAVVSRSIARRRA